ncbi:CyP450 monooxygenase [Trametes cingulata]|nr:CyP450 monooxygenase [Trametes cingulata]
MATYIPSLSACGAVLIVFVLTAKYVWSILAWRARTKGVPLPPGPRPLPIVGNLLELPRTKEWIGLRDMCATYGDMVYLRVPGQSLLVIGSADMAVEYLEKRSANSSDRLPSVLVELSGQGLNMGFMPYGPWWRRHRRAFWQYFNPAMAVRYQPIQRDSMYGLLVKLLESPERIKAHVKSSFSEMMLKILFDKAVVSESDPYVDIVHTAMEAIKCLAPIGSALQMFPFLKYVPSWFPGAGFQEALERCRIANQRIKDVPFDEVKESIERGDVRACVAAEMLARSKIDRVPSQDQKDELEIFKNVCAVSFEAGSDTSFAAVYAAFVALALNPEKQRKAQAELDAVVGPSRMPDCGDSDALVYVNAIVREVLRWHVIVPLGTAHRTIEDDEFHGYFIPGGTCVIANVWDVLHDPKAYEDPEEFRPERFLRDGKLDSTVRDPTSFMFGFGRRICPGRYFASTTLFLTVACVLHTFDIELPLDENGERIHAEYKPTPGFLSYPEDIPLVIKPRSAEAVTLIRDTQSHLVASQT